MKEITLSLRDEAGLLARLPQETKKQVELLKRCSLGEARYRESLGWLSVDEWAGEEMLSRLEELAEKVQRDAELLVVVGVGGSNQAARAVIEAIGEKSGVKILWAGNSISAHSMNHVLEQIGDKRFYVNVIAKNFETLEPGLGFRMLCGRLQEKYGQAYAQHLICTGTAGSHLHRLCMQNGFAFLPFPDNIGGRFSGISPVGLFPMAAAGMDIRALAAGAGEMERRLKNLPAEENPALRYAVIRNCLYRAGYRIEMLASFEPRLRRFSKWWMQLFGESEGKENLGLYPVCGNYSEDLHSIGQFVQEGTPILFETFVDVLEPGSVAALAPLELDDRFHYLDGKELGEINRAALEATLDAHARRFPCNVLQVPALDENTFGQLFYFFMFACYLSAELLGVDPFDQPGVEDYKKRMFARLGKPADAGQ